MFPDGGIVALLAAHGNALVMTPGAPKNRNFAGMVIDRPPLSILIRAASTIRPMNLQRLPCTSGFAMFMPRGFIKVSRDKQCLADRLPLSQR